MKKKWSKALSLALAVSMCANGVSVTTDNGAKVVAATKKKQAATEKKGEALKTSKKETKAYAEGQAIVMYRNNEDTVKGLSLGKAAKDILIKQGFDRNKTEHEIMLERKIYRIYDCGCNVYKFINNKFNHTT